MWKQQIIMMNSSQLTVMSSFKLFPLISKWVNELEMLELSDNECAIWLAPFDVRPQWLMQSLQRPLEIFAIGPAKWSAPVWVDRLKREFRSWS